MDTISIQLLLNEPNSTVVKLPDRKFPGIVLQGDSLKILLDLVDDARNLIIKDDLREAEDTLEELKMILTGYRQIYEAALVKEGISLPY